MNVYFHCRQLNISSKNERSFFEECFDASVNKISNNPIADPSSKDFYKSITCGELILRRSVIFESVKAKLVDILKDDWSRIFTPVEIDKFSDSFFELNSFKFWEEIYVDPNANPRMIKPKTKVLCFYDDLYEIMNKFIMKTLE